MTKHCHSPANNFNDTFMLSVDFECAEDGVKINSLSLHKSVIFNSCKDKSLALQSIQLFEGDVVSITTALAAAHSL